MNWPCEVLLKIILVLRDEQNSERLRKYFERIEEFLRLKEFREICE